MNKDPLVSIIIRTCERPSILRNALESVKNQTYNNIEVIIIEDGKNTSEEMINSNYSEISFKYFCTGMKKGRTIAGNLGLLNSSGTYLNFLDDDDILFPNHVEELVRELIRNDSKAVYSVAEEHQIRVLDKNPYQYKTLRKFIRYRYPYNKLLLFYMNYIPIQSIMFHRSLYDTCGGFDENLTVLEDWDLWVRYSTMCDFLFLDKITSVYFTPYKNKDKHTRDIEIKHAADKVIEKHKSYIVKMSVADINSEMDYILNVFNKKGIIFYMKKIRNYLLYKDI